MVKRKLTPAEAINEALAAINIGRIEKAKKIHDALVSLNSPALSPQIQRLKTRIAKHEEALFDRAHNRQASPTLERALELYEKNKFNESAQMCKDLILQDNNSADAWNVLGAASIRALHHKEAADAFKRALAIEPRRADLHLNYGSALEKLGDIKRAISACQKAVKLQPTLSEAHCVLGHAYRRKNENSKAIKAYKKSLSLRPGFAASMDGLSDVYMKIGKRTLSLDLRAQAEGLIAFGPGKNIKILETIDDA